MAPADDDISIEEKRVYAATAGRTDVYVASGAGVVRIAVSGDRVGTFELVDREPARDVAVIDGGTASDSVGENDPAAVLAVAGEEQFRIARLNGSASDPTFLPVEESGEGPFVAVDGDEDAFLTARSDGTVLRVECAAELERSEVVTLESTVEAIGDVDGAVAIDGGLIAGKEGVFRPRAKGDRRLLERVGLTDVRDVAGRGVPLAATATGLYWLGNGWMDAFENPFERVAADGNGHAMAVDVDGTLYVHFGDGPAGGDWGNTEWDESTLPVDAGPVALGYGSGIACVVTADGTLCVDAGDGWRHQPVGVRDVHGIAVAGVDGADTSASR